MKETLEEYVKGLKAELKSEKAKREESEFKHAVVCEALENLLDDIDLAAIPQGAFYISRKVARKALNGVTV